jgi:uncharacterized membrane protein
MPEHSPKQNPCQAACHRCEDGEQAGESQEQLAGWRLGLAAASGFLLPLVLAVTGAAVSPASWQWVGCAAGLAAGLFVAGALGKAFRSASVQGGRA